MGIISPVGNRLDEAWKNVCEGVSGVQLIEDFDTSTFPTRIGGIVNNFDPLDYMPPNASSGVERAHKDGIQITPESPEAMEEVRSVLSGIS